MTTQTANAPKPGDLLQNRAHLLATRTKADGAVYVLALFNREFVTWLLSNYEPLPRLGNLLDCHHHGDNLSQALEALAAR